MSEGKVRRRYDRAFKEGAVRLVVEDGQTLAGTARDLGITETMLTRWRKEYPADEKQALKSGGILEADDLAQRRFQADRPGEIRVSDITHIRTREGWLYLTAVLDLHNRGVVG